jgi:hypothetical protein
MTEIYDPTASSRRIARDDLYSVTVSTVELPLSLGFETMVFGGVYDLAQWRYETWDEAMEGHRTWVGRVQRSQTRFGRLTFLASRLGRRFRRLEILHQLKMVPHRLIVRIRKPQIKECESGGITYAFYVNGKAVNAYWPMPGQGQKAAHGEALSEAVRLACLAHPKVMKNFPCGSTL